MSAAQGTNDKLYLARVLRIGLGHYRVSRATSLRLARAPRRHQKRPIPRGTFLPCAEGHVEPLGKAESHGGPKHGARSIDVTPVILP
jgi:hypothetical protein